MHAPVDSSPTEEVHQGTEAEFVATAASITAVHTLEQVSSVVETRVTSPVRRCGPGYPSRARVGAMVNRPNPAGISSAVVSN
jgi:hypothetical protein